MTIRVPDLDAAASLGSGTSLLVSDPARPEPVAIAGLQVVADALPRRVASAFVSANVVQTVIATSQTYVPVQVDNFTAIRADDFTFAASTPTATYTGSTARWFMAWLTACITMPDQNQEVRIRLTLQGNTLPQTCARTSVTGTPGSARAANLSTHTLLQLQPGEVVGVAIGNWTSGSNITIRNLQLSLLEV